MQNVNIYDEICMQLKSKYCTQRYFRIPTKVIMKLILCLNNVSVSKSPAKFIRYDSFSKTPKVVTSQSAS